jgi:hypothetical protein
MIKNLFHILLACCAMAACVKDVSSENVYQSEMRSIQILMSPDSIPADGSSQAKIDIHVLPNDQTDSINLAGFNFTVTTSLGTFASNSQTTISLQPSYGLDSTGTKRRYNAEIMLASGTKPGKAMLKIKYSNVEVDTSIDFYTAYPNKIKLTASSLLTAPDFSQEDTIYLQLSSTTGLPSAGAVTTLTAYDTTMTRPLGLFRISNNKSNATGLCYYIFVLGDSTINRSNYLGTVNLVAAAFNGQDSIKNTLQIYSR